MFFQALLKDLAGRASGRRRPRPRRRVAAGNGGKICEPDAVCSVPGHQPDAHAPRCFACRFSSPGRCPRPASTHTPAAPRTLRWRPGWRGARVGVLADSARARPGARGANGAGCGGVRRRRIRESPGAVPRARQLANWPVRVARAAAAGSAARCDGVFGVQHRDAAAGSNVAALFQPSPAAPVRAAPAAPCAGAPIRAHGARMAAGGAQ